MPVLTTELGEFAADTPEECVKKCREAERKAKAEAAQRERERRIAFHNAFEWGYRYLCAKIKSGGEQLNGERLPVNSKWAPPMEYKGEYHISLESPESGERPVLATYDPAIAFVWDGSGIVRGVFLQTRCSLPGECIRFYALGYHGKEVGLQYCPTITPADFRQIED